MSCVLCWGHMGEVSRAGVRWVLGFIEVICQQVTRTLLLSMLSRWSLDPSNLDRIPAAPPAISWSSRAEFFVI